MKEGQLQNTADSDTNPAADTAAVHMEGTSHTGQESYLKPFFSRLGFNYDTAAFIWFTGMAVLLAYIDFLLT